MECALAFGVISAIICGFIAASKGRNVAGWAVVGFLLGLIGIIICAVMSNLKEEQARHARMLAENRRLREQLHQEQIKSETFREHAIARLDAHDQHLGLDTRTLGAGPAVARPPQLPGYSPVADNPLSALEAMGQPAGGQPAAGSTGEATEWFYQDRDDTQGPLDAADLRHLLQSGKLTGETLVWAEHMDTWQPAREVPEFKAQVRT